MSLTSILFQFLHCNFGGQHFESPHFDGCSFESCKIQGVNFNDSSFRECRFIGVIEDTTFNGLYHKKPTGFKILDRVDFSQTVFGDFVTFEDCDLPTCIPPPLFQGSCRDWQCCPGISDG